MLTRHAWTLSLGGTALAVAGRMFGVYELFILGTAAVGLVVIAAIWAGLARLKVSVTRSV